MKYIKKLFKKKPYIGPLTILVVGLSVFSAVAVANLKVENTANKVEVPQQVVAGTSDEKEPEGQITPEAYSTEAPISNQTNRTLPTNTPYIAPTSAPAHSNDSNNTTEQKVIETKVEVVVTATPQPTTIPENTSTPTVEQLEARIVLNGKQEPEQPTNGGSSMFIGEYNYYWDGTISVLANKPLSGCIFSITGDLKNKSVEGNTCRQGVRIGGDWGVTPSGYVEVYAESGEMLTLEI